MLFTEPTFLLLFLPVLLALYFVTIAGAARLPGSGPAHLGAANGILLIASVLFYVKGGGAFTWLMLASIAFNYWMARAIDSSRSFSDAPGAAPPRARAAAGSEFVEPGRPQTLALSLTAAAVAVNLIVLGIFKYANFFADNVNALLGLFNGPAIHVQRVLLPIGISFFTFHAISYVVDVYRRDAIAQKSPVHAALYLLLFPQLIAGPIIRYRDIADQLGRRTVSLEDFAYGVRRFIIGLAKKVLIANVVAGPADAIFRTAPAKLGPAVAWLGVVCYTLQIYFDFSGYSDMAIGLARMFGFRFPENFRWPYVAASVQDFWRRWHISLSTWFRDYLFVPLGGSRGSPAATYRNLVTVFFLCGLWHGASWTFVVWGLFHGMFLVAERIGLADAVRRVWPPLGHAYLLLVVMVGWVFFRADTLSGAAGILAAMAGRAPLMPAPFTLGWYLTPEVALAIAVGMIGAMPIVPALGRWHEHVAREQPGTAGWGLSAAGVAALALLLVASIVQIAARSYNPFIYFRF